MLRWLHLATRNWRVRPGRAIAVVLSVALGVATVVMVTGFYETARRMITDEVVANWVGTAHLSVEPPGAHWGQLNISLVEPIAELDNVKHVTARLKRRMFIVHEGRPGRFIETGRTKIDAIGINPETEKHFRALPSLQGRLFGPEERGVAVIEQGVAVEWGVGLGDDIVVSPYRRGAGQSFKIVGLFESQRLADFQKPAVYLPLADVQTLGGEQGAASIIEIMLVDSAPEKIDAAQARIEHVIAERNLPYKVESAKGRQTLLNEAERITRMLLVLTAFISMLTSFFIILTTMSMSLIQRRPVFGVMRCVGVTRAQLTALLLLELVPLGLLGTALGVGLGIWWSRLLPALSRMMFPPTVYFNTWGIGLAVGSGVATTLLSTLALWGLIIRVTPLQAVNPEARPARTRYSVIAGVIGVALIGLHEWMRVGVDAVTWFEPAYAFAGTFSLYLGYVLLAPVLVLSIGRPLARAVAATLGLKGRLAEDQFGRAPWRSAGVCWMLLVGLSLIVYVAVRVEGFYAVWAFPRRLPETFVWSPEYVSGDVIERVKRIPGVGTTTVVTDVDCEILSPGKREPSLGGNLLDGLLKKMTRPVFVAGEVDQLFGLMKIGFAEGSLADAKGKLRRGGYVVIPTQTAQQHGLHLGDTIRISIQGREAEFTVAGVVQSPALDIAVNFFQAESYMQFAAASAMLGTRADLKEKFDLDVVSMFMSNLDMPPMPVPEEFTRPELMDTSRRPNLVEWVQSWAESLPNQRDVLAPILAELAAFEPSGSPLSPAAEEELQRFAHAVDYASWRWDRRTPEQRWAVFRERLVLTRIAREMDRPDAIIGSVTRLVEAVDKSLRRATTVITWMPSVALLVAAIGIGNLMMVSVHARSRQIAILRAVGAVRSQIIRLVLTEAITLALLGCAMGLALGFQQAHTVNQLAGELSGIHLECLIPYGTLLLSIGLTVGVCVLAGLGPARYAARSNIISALQTT